MSGVFSVSAMSTFGSFMLLLLILIEAAPPTASSIPTLGIYYCFNMVIIMLAIILSSLVVNISRGGSNNVPGWLYFITIRCLGVVVCLHNRRAPPPRRSKYAAIRGAGAIGGSGGGDSPHRNPGNGAAASGGSGGEELDLEPLKTPTTMTTTTGAGDISNGRLVMTSSPAPHAGHVAALRRDTCFSSLPITPEVHALHSIERQIVDVKSALHKMEERLETRTASSREAHDKQSEWKHVAVILDRFFFIVYLVLILVSLCTMFPTLM